MTHVKGLLLLLALALGCASAEQPGVIRGRLLAPASVSLSGAVIALHTANGESRRTFVDSDGTFVLHDVPPGTHMLQPFLLALMYPEVRLEVNRKQVLVRASLTHNRQVTLHSPLLLRPAGEAQYYEKRKPIDIWGVAKSPYGLMILFSIFAIFVFPRMKVDAEEYREMQAALKPGETAAAEPPARQQGGNRIRDR